MCRLNHGVAADYFAVGVIAYECMLGKAIIYKLINFIETLSWKVKKRDKRASPF